MEKTNSRKEDRRTAYTKNVIKDAMLELLDPYMTLLPVCQRVSDNPKYRVMFRDMVVSSYILKELYRQEVGNFTNIAAAQFGLERKQAEKLFLFTITGAFEVIKAMGWKKDTDWYEVQKILLTFLSGGYESLRQIKGAAK